MRRILFIIAMLLMLNIALNGKDYDMDKIMPKKLVYAELPDDYPKELDELFIFYWDIAQIYTEMIKEPGSLRIELNNYMTNLTFAERRNLVYLIWLASNAIPEYYEEYISINDDPWNKRNQMVHTWNEIDRLSIYPEIRRTEAKKGNKTPDMMSSITRINNWLKSTFEDNQDVINKFYYPKTWPIWVRAKVLDSEWVDGNGCQLNSPILYFLRLSIIDSWGDQFKEKEITLMVRTHNPGYQFEIESEYLVNLGFHISESDFLNRFNLQKIEIFPHRNYSTFLSKIHLIENDSILANYPFKGGILSIDTHSETIFQGKGSIGYNTEKNKYLDYINYLKGESDE